MERPAGVASEWPHTKYHSLGQVAEEECRQLKTRKRSRAFCFWCMVCASSQCLLVQFSLQLVHTRAQRFEWRFRIKIPRSCMFASRDDHRSVSFNTDRSVRRHLFGHRWTWSNLHVNLAFECRTFSALLVQDVQYIASAGRLVHCLKCRAIGVRGCGFDSWQTVRITSCNVSPFDFFRVLLKKPNGETSDLK